MWENEFNLTEIISGLTKQLSDLYRKASSLKKSTSYRLEFICYIYQDRRDNGQLTDSVKL